MEHHLERKVILNTTSDFKNLYNWSLSEIGDEASRPVNNQIPWDWSLYFMLEDIQIFSSVSMDRYGSKDATITEKDFIQAKLRPGHRRDRHTATAFSMFGTNRKILDFSLSIYPLCSGEKEHCRIRGSVSYTWNNDFVDETSDDELFFSVFVTPERFAAFAALIANHSVAGGSLNVGHVAGFYSDWSPSISTSHVKVLTSSERDHPVEVPEGCDIQPPRLGDNNEFDITLWSASGRLIPHDPDDQSDIGPELPVVARHGNAEMHWRSPIDAKTLGVLKSLRLAAWIIAALLVVLAFK